MRIAFPTATVPSPVAARLWTRIRPPRAFCALAALVVCSAALFAQGTGVPPPDALDLKGQAAHPTRLLAQLKTGVAHAKAAATVGGAETEISRRFATMPDLVVLDLTPARAGALAAQSADGRREVLLQRMAALKATGLFEYVEPDWVVYADAVPTDSAFTDGTLWGLRNTGQNGGVAGIDIGAERVWDITTGDRNVIVAVIDTGINYNHQDLAASMWHNPGETPGNGIDDDANGFVDDYYGVNAITGGGDPLDDHDHGSHCAGTIGAVANGGGPHVGVCWQVSLMACKFLNSAGSGYTSDAITCIDYAIGKGAQVLSNSWGGGGYSASLKSAITRARNAGILFVAAAGNSSANTDTSPNYPSCYDVDNVISVAAIDRTGALAWFSNYGLTSVDLGAPGVSIYSCTRASNSSYASFNGTSMATPHVAGVAALVRSAFPGITVQQLRQRILDAAVPTASLAGTTVTGGRVNAFESVRGSLADALDTANLRWATTGDAAWEFQTAVTYDGTDAAVSGAVGDSRSSTLQTTATGPCDLSFRWKVDSEAGGDVLRFVVDGVPQDEISGAVDWQQMNYSLVPGTHTLRWIYQKNGAVAAGADAGWVDTVSYLSTAPPVITSAGSAGGAVGLPFTYRITATESPTSFSVTGALPGGLALDTGTGVIAGVPTASGTATVTIGATNPFGTATAPLVIGIIVIPPLGDAVDAPALTWTTGGDTIWFSEIDVTYDGVDAAQSGPLLDNESSRIETAITGPAILQFRWRVDSEDYYDYLDFYLDGGWQRGISGTQDWAPQTYNIPAGAHALRWEYSKDFSVSKGADAGWLDTVTVITDPPAITSPTTANGALGEPFTYQITATGAPAAFGVTGALPSGLTLAGGTGLITGFPRASGTTAVTITATSFLGTGNQTLTVVIPDPPPLGDTLDAPEWTWTTGGGGQWFGQTSVSYDGVDAARSGFVTAGQTSWLETAVAGPAVLSFHWKLAAADGDSLAFYLDGQLQDALGGAADWRRQSYLIPAGSHTARWVYSETHGTAAITHLGWVDAVTLGADIPPAITDLILSGSAGTPVAGEPAGTYYTKLGIPAVNDAGASAFLATIKRGTLSTAAILSGTAPAVLVRQGATAPGTGGATFRSFKDPLLNQAGRTAFAASLTGAGVAANNNGGLWTDAFGGGLRLVAREGDAAAEGGGALLRSFNAAALESGTAAPPRVAYVAKLTGPAVTTGNDVGLFSYDGSTTRLLLREGMSVVVGGSTGTLTKFTVLAAVRDAEGHGFGLSDGVMSAVLSLGDGTTAVATIHADGTDPEIVAREGDPAPGYTAGERLNALKAPAQNSRGGAVFLATVSGTTRAQTSAGIFAVAGGGGGGLARVAAKGESAGITPAATFDSFLAAAHNADDQVAFLARVAATGVTTANDAGLWVVEDSTPVPVAREGGTAPATGGATWRGFQSLARPDGADVLFAAALAVGTGSPATAAATDTGLWARDADGILRLLVREGVTALGGKTVKSFKVLGTVAGSPAQSRSHNGAGTIVYQATFLDHTQGIVTVQMP